MTDYGHQLQFGSFITPVAADPTTAIELATVSEQAGLDLVTFQDHPYQPGFLDTWTLLSFVAARTSRVQLSANVTNLPLRPPAVLARAVASLDRLSDGRVELGIGAGGFWDAIEGMGGRRLTGGESVRALEEAIDVIRQLWDTDTRGGVRMNGQFYSAHGAKRGPAPAHDISIWVGGLKPKMLALTGRRADGWLPSMAYLKPGDLTAGNALVSEAAQEAGRSPGDVRRLLNVTGQFGATSRGPLNGPPDHWADELAELALTEGISTFILASDNPVDLRRFAGEVAPAVREVVQAGRSSETLAAPETSAPPDAPRRSTVVTGTGSAARSHFAVQPTADDGRRRSAKTAWDESIRPQAPARDPERTYTAAAQASAQRLIDVHNMLRDELGQILDLTDQVAAGLTDIGAARSRLNAMTLRQNNWTLGAYCQSYSRTVTTHHLIEDRSMFPQLQRSVPDVAPVLERLTAEHHILHDVLEGVDRALIALVSAPDDMAEFTAAVDLLSDALLSHLAYEERELVEPIARSGVALG